MKHWHENSFRINWFVTPEHLAGRKCSHIMPSDSIDSVMWHFQQRQNIKIGVTIALCQMKWKRNILWKYSSNPRDTTKSSYCLLSFLFVWVLFISFSSQLSSLQCDSYHNSITHGPELESNSFTTEIILFVEVKIKFSKDTMYNGNGNGNMVFNEAKTI